MFNMIDKKISKYQQEMLNNGIYTMTLSKYGKKFLENKENRKENFETLKNWDLTFPLDYNTGAWIESLIESDSITFGIHRSSFIDGENLYNDETLKAIINDGLMMTGDFGAIYNNNISLSKNISFSENSLLSSMINIKAGYKGSNSVLLFAFPKELVQKDGTIVDGKESEIFDIINGNQHVKTQYLCGVLAKVNNKCILHTVEELKENMNKKTI